MIKWILAVEKPLYRQWSPRFCQTVFHLNVAKRFQLKWLKVLNHVLLVFSKFTFNMKLRSFFCYIYTFSTNPSGVKHSICYFLTASPSQSNTYVQSFIRSNPVSHLTRVVVFLSLVLKSTLETSQSEEVACLVLVISVEETCFQPFQQILLK